MERIRAENQWHSLFNTRQSFIWSGPSLPDRRVHFQLADVLGYFLGSWNDKLLKTSQTGGRLLKLSASTQVLFLTNNFNPILSFDLEDANLGLTLTVTSCNPPWVYLGWCSWNVFHNLSFYSWWFPLLSQIEIISVFCGALWFLCVFRLLWKSITVCSHLAGDRLETNACESLHPLILNNTFTLQLVKTLSLVGHGWTSYFCP